MATRDEIEALIAQMGTGDRAAFRTLYNATSAKLFGVVLRVLNNRAAAEDALQDVFVKIWQNADRYRANGLSPMTWLITIARNTAIDRLRRKRAISSQPVEDMADRLADPTPGPEAQAVQAGEAARLDACLEALEDAKSDAVRGAYMEGETYAELAQRFDVPLNTMRTWLRRSLIKLKDCLSQ